MLGWSCIRKTPPENGTAKVPDDNEDNMEEISGLHHSENTSGSLSTSL